MKCQQEVPTEYNGAMEKSKASKPSEKYAQDDRNTEAYKGNSAKVANRD